MAQILNDSKANYSTSSEDKLSPALPVIRSATSLLLHALVCCLNAKIHKDLNSFIKGAKGMAKSKTLESILANLEFRVRTIIPSIHHLLFFSSF